MDGKLITKDALPASMEFKTYRKKTLTEIAGPYDPPVTVRTITGDHFVSDEPCFIAVDEKGYPYPIAASLMASTYEEMPDGDNTAS